MKVGMSGGSSTEASNKITTIRNTVKSFLKEKNSFTYVFELAEKYTKVNREYLFWGKSESRGDSCCCLSVVCSSYEFCIVQVRQGVVTLYTCTIILLLGIVAVLIVYLVIGHGAGLIVNLLGFVYPAYKS